MELEFFMPMIPPTCTYQEKAVKVVKGKPVFYDPPELQAARQKLMGHLAQHKPETPFTGAVWLQTTWLFPCGTQHAIGEYRTTKPDTDNLQKLLKDCMTVVGFWHDDAQVVVEFVQKRWNDVPGIHIHVCDL